MYRPIIFKFKRDTTISVAFDFSATDFERVKKEEREGRTEGRKEAKDTETHIYTHKREKRRYEEECLWVDESKIQTFDIQRRDTKKTRERFIENDLKEFIERRPKIIEKGL